MKKFVKDNYFYIIVFIMFFLFSLLFPYSGDDWVWGTYKLDSSLLSNLASDLELNGRYIGNIIAIILAKNVIIRGVIMSLVITLMIRLINKYTKGSKYLSLFVIVLMPATIFKQVIPWSAGFANYMVSHLILFYIFDIIIKDDEKLTWLIMLLCFIGSFFLENVTIFIMILTIFLNIKYYFKNKKINKLYLFAFIGSLIGTIIMFSQPSYIANFSGANKVRFVGQKDGLFGMIIKNYFNDFMLYGVISNYVVFALLEILLFYYCFKNNLLNNKNLSVFIITYLLLLYMVLSQTLDILTYKYYLNGAMATLYLICILLLMYLIFKGKKEFNYIWWIILTCIVISGPLLIVSQVGPRNFISVNLLLDILLLKLYKDLVGKDLLVYKILLVLLIGYLSYVFILIHKVYKERENYIMEHKCHYIIYVPKMVYHKYLWWADFDYELGDYYPMYYKKYRNLDESIKFVFYDYDIWKNIKDEISTCS